ncbi:hypothetical protein DYB34_005800 [Aphanomyces astaci]|uniref:Dynein heavy chain tail domain-containing protein n=2 Tax=Aphanomyces astaci TaxID=112090 RepID=A0A3R7DJB4_APHAT|nr:hypothetical protein DYB34_005800 [Aphanomyces astaci]
MDVAVAAYIERYGTVEDILVLDLGTSCARRVKAITFMYGIVSCEWRRWARDQLRWRTRFQRLYLEEFTFLAGEQDEAADSQADWRLVCVQHDLGYASGYHLGAFTAQDEASMLRWLFVTRQAINQMSRTMTDVLATSPPELMPLHEATYWQRSEEHLKLLQDSLGGWTAGESSAWHPEWNVKLADHVQTIKKLHNQAQWNAKYFKVLEPPFQAILATDMTQIPFIVPPMIKTLKMMWWHDVYDPSSTVWGPFDMYSLFHRVDSVAQRCSEVRMQNCDDGSHIDPFEQMLQDMDRDLHRHWGAIDDVFAERHSATWQHGMAALRTHSDALLQFVHRLQDKVPIY